MLKKCEFCENEFNARISKTKFCSTTCAQGVKKFKRVSKECEYTGCTNTFIIAEDSTRVRKFCCVGCQIDWQKTSQLGENKGNYGRENKWGVHDDEMRALISVKISESWKKEIRVIKHNEARERFKLIHGYLPTNSPSAREKRSEQQVIRCLETGHLTTYKNCKRGYYLNKKNGGEEYFHSSWEENLMKMLDDDINVVNWTKKHSIIIKYKHDGIQKSYLPDFLIEYNDGRKIIEEVKGYIDNVEVFKLKKKACEEYCLNNGITYKINFMKNYEKYKHLL